jgi:hypothetical protein
MRLYDFVGFSQPVDNNGVLNVANAGKTIPLKWRVLTEAGAPVTNLTSASVSTVAISCSTGGSTDVIEELAASPTSLINHGNGNYQLNWKTDKSLSGCRRMRLSLSGEGPVTHDALFQFR